MSEQVFVLSVATSPERTRGEIEIMSATRNDGLDDMDSGHAAEQSETRMRQALERLSGERFGGAPRPQPAPHSPTHSPAQSSSFSSAGPRRHRYVQDGEVPVVQISPAGGRRRDVMSSAPVPSDAPADNLRQAVAQERAGRMRAEQALERAQATIHALETRLGHAEITQREAADLARAHAADVARLRGELAEQAGWLKAAQTEAAEARERQRELEYSRAEARYADDTDDDVVVEPPPLRAKTVKPRVAKAAIPVVEVDEPEPVKWWLTAAPVVKRRARL